MRNEFCRICWKTSGWVHPTGSAIDGPNSYYWEHGFGHEEWLFKYDWLIDGYRYGFLQPIGKFLAGYSGHNCSILLYTLMPEGEMLLIGRIVDAYIPKISELQEVLSTYKNRGWLDRMRADVRNIDGDADVLEDPQPSAIANVRFLPDDMKMFDPRQQVVGDHVILRNLRYHPFNWTEGNCPTVESPTEGLK